MRFITTESLTMVEFTQKILPPYGILSHRWETEEVSFQDMQYKRMPPKKKGFYKIRRCCQQARNDDLDYLWVDTCCIDKTSSAELQEALNSMFQWYQNAKICYTYLCDVEAQAKDLKMLSLQPSASKQSFMNSKQFTRG